MINSCPVCGKYDQVEDVIKLYACGSAFINRFAPPVEPKVGMNPDVRLVRLVAMALFGISSYALLGLAAGSVWFLFASGLLVGLLVIVPLLHRRYWLRYREQVARRELWRRAILRWQKLYHCSRDDYVFDPDTAEAVPTSWMSDLIAEGPQADRDAPAPRAWSWPARSLRACNCDEIGFLLAVNGLLLTLPGIVAAITSLGIILDPNHLASQMLWQFFRLLGSTIFFFGLALVGFSAIRYSN